MQSPKSSDIELGHHHNSRVMRSNLVSHPLSPSFSSQMGDYIGTESCLDSKNYKHLLTENREDENNGARVQNYVRGKRDQRCSMKQKKKKEFPPPISLLARTENQPSRMPFVLKRYYTNDGRLILREERVRHYEYFIKAYRSNGHLTLQLVHLDDDVLAPPFSDENENEVDEPYCNAEEEQVEEATDDFVENGEKKIVRKNTEEARAKYESKIAKSSVENGSVPRAMGENGGGGGKCLKYNSVGINSPCFLGMPVQAIKPVHT